MDQLTTDIVLTSKLIQFRIQLIVGMNSSLLFITNSFLLSEGSMYSGKL